MIEAGLAFIVILALAAAIASLRGVAGAAAPLLALCTIMVYFTWAVVLDVLVPAGCVFIALSVLFFALALWRRRREMAQKLLSPGFLLFAAAGLVLLITFAIRQPVFKMWDEFSFWGTVAKLMKLSGRSYALALGDAGFFTTQTQSPGLIVLTWFCQFFATEFVPWQMYWAYDLLIVASACVLLAPFTLREWQKAVPMAAAGLLIPFFFTQGYHTITLATAYLSGYGDVPAGMLFGAALALYFMVRRQKGGALWQTALPLAALGGIKDNLITLALAAAGVMAADALFFGVDGALSEKTAALAAKAGARFKVPAPLRRLLPRLGMAAVWFTSTLLAYLPWSRHAAWAAAQNPLFANREGGETNMPLAKALRLGFMELFGLEPRSAPMARVLNELGHNFTGSATAGDGFVPGTYKVSMAGSPLITTLLVLAVFAAALCLLAAKREKWRAALSGAVVLGGFAAYHFMLIVFWAIFSHTRETTGVVDYERYISSYFIGWFMLGLALLALAAAQPEKTLKPMLAGACALALSLLMLVRFSVLVRPGYNVLDFSQSLYATERGRMGIAQSMAGQIPPGERVFFVCQAEDGGVGEEWEQYHQYLLPVILDYSLTGGWHFVPETPDFPDGVSLEEMRAYLAERGFRYIFVEKLDAVFVREYGVLFEDGMENWNSPALYRLGDDGLFAEVWRHGNPV